MKFNYFDNDAILEAAGIDLPTSDPQRARIARQIADDHLVQNRAQALSIDPWIIESIRQLSGPEKAALKKRCGVPTPASERKPAIWSVGQTTPTESTPSQTFVQVRCDECRQTAYFRQPEYFLEPVKQTQGRNDKKPKIETVEHPVTSLRVMDAVDNLKFFHCGGYEFAPEHVRAAAKAAWMQAVTE
jgi:hypothetical protein